MERSLFSLLILCLVSSSLIPSSSAQMNDSRCVQPTRDDDFIKFCRAYYSSDVGYINGSEIIGLQTALRRINNMYGKDENILNPCVDLMLNYLCNYYFPQCDISTGEVTPVCSTSCALLGNNEDCVDLREMAYGILENNNVSTPGEACFQTFRSYDNPPTVLESCLSIEDSLNESLPLTCIEVPLEETCRPQLPYTYYAPATFDSTAQIFTEIQEIISQLDPFNSCRVFINTVICVFRFPSCNPETGRILGICPNVCPTIDSIITDCSLEFFRNNPDFPAVNELLDTFVCLDPETYYNFPAEYIETEPEDCSQILQNSGNSTTSPSDNDDNDDGNDIAAIVGIVVGIIIAVAVVIVVMVILYCVKRKGDAKGDYGTRQDSHNEYAEQPVASAVRYHVHDEDHLGLNLTYASNAPSPYLTPRSMLKNEADTLKNSRSSMLLMEMNDLLLSVKDKFHEVLLPVESITKQGLLGKGAFGVVHKGELIESDETVETVAIKTIKSSSLDAMKDLIAESAIMKTFHHPNVLPLLGVCIDYDDEDVLKIVMPFMSNGDLKNFLKDSRVSANNTHELPKDISEANLLKMCYDIAKGMEYLAEKRFIHRDLAARNCMVDKFLSIKIADFGLAKDIYTTEYYRVEKHTTLPVKWMSLESLLDGFFDEKTDVWSYGVTCWEVFSLGRLPYPGVDNANVITLLKNGKRLEQPELCPTKLYELITSTWFEDPEDRPTFAMIVKDLCSICDFTEAAVADEESVKDTNDDTAAKNGYISILPPS